MYKGEGTRTNYRTDMLNRLNCEQTELPSEIAEVALKLAKANHEGWMKGKMAKGYVYGVKTNDDPKNGPLTSPLLVPFEDLDDETKQANLANVQAIVRIMVNKGVVFMDFSMVLYAMAKEIHDDWCAQKFAAGWVCGDVTDKPNKVHRDLRPFEELLADPNLAHDVDYDVDTARQTLIMMIADCDIFPAILRPLAFALKKGT